MCGLLRELLPPHGTKSALAARCAVCGPLPVLSLFFWGFFFFFFSLLIRQHRSSDAKRGPVLQLEDEKRNAALSRCWRMI